MIAKSASCKVATSKVTTRDANRASCKIATIKVTTRDAKSAKETDAQTAR